MAKRIINGRTYDTQKSKRVAGSEIYKNDDGDDCMDRIWQTSGGAFFMVSLTYDEEAADWNDTSFMPMTREEAHKWVNTGSVELFENVFGDEFPEAEEEKEDEKDPIVMVSYRVPTSLKRNIDRAAAQQGKSANAWALNCLQSCVG